MVGLAAGVAGVSSVAGIACAARRVSGACGVGSVLLAGIRGEGGDVVFRKRAVVDITVWKAMKFSRYKKDI